MICTQCERLFIGSAISWPGPHAWSAALWVPTVCAACRARNTIVSPDEEQDLPVPVPSPELSGFKTRRGQFFAARNILIELAIGERIRAIIRRRGEWHEEEEDDHDLFRM